VLQLSDREVHGYFADILGKAKKFCKPEMKESIAELEERIVSALRCCAQMLVSRASRPPSCICVVQALACPPFSLSPPIYTYVRGAVPIGFADTHGHTGMRVHWHTRSTYVACLLPYPTQRHVRLRRWLTRTPMPRRAAC